MHQHADFQEKISMDSTVMSPGPGPTLMANDARDKHGHGHGHDRLWEHAILREVSDEGRHKSDRDFHFNSRIHENESRTADRVFSLERRVVEGQADLRALIVESTAKITDLLKDQKLNELRDKIAAIPRGVDINIPVTL